MKVKKGWLLLLFLIVVLALLKWWLFPGTKSSTDAKPSKGIVSVTALVVSGSEFTDEISVSGTVIPAESVLLQPEVSGKVISVHFNEGSTVSAGQLLVKLNDAELQAQRKKLTAQINQARIDWERNKNLWGSRAISKEVLDASALQVQILEAELDLNSAQIDKTEIKAPFNGKIGNRNISVGAGVTPSTGIATVYQSQALKIKFFIPSVFRSGMEQNALVGVQLPDGSKSEARIYSIEPSADPESGSFEARAILNSNAGISPGDFVSVILRKMPVNNAIRIPTESLVPVLKGNRVYVVQQGKAIAKDVVTGTRNDSSVLIVSGLNSGDSLITGGLMFVKPGISVNVRKTKSVNR